MLFSIHTAKLLHLFPSHPMDEHGSSRCYTFLTVTLSYHSKVTPIGTLHAEKIAEAGLLYVFNRPGVAGAVLQTPPSLIHSFIN